MSAQRLAGLGPHRLGKSCLYVKRLDDRDSTVLRDLIATTSAPAF